MTNITFLMRQFQMSSELINIIESLLTESTSWMEQDQITILTKLSVFNVSLILSIRIKYLLGLNTFSIVKTNITILFFMFNVEMLFKLVQTVK